MQKKINREQEEVVLFPLPLGALVAAGIQPGISVEVTAEPGTLTISSASDSSDVECDGNCETCPVNDMECDDDCEHCPCKNICEDSEVSDR